MSLFADMAAGALYPVSRAVMGEAVTIDGIAASVPFNKAYVLQTFDGTSEGLQSVAPVIGPVSTAYLTSLGITPSDAPGAESVVVARGVTYRVQEIRPDGVDGVRLVLAV